MATLCLQEEEMLAENVKGFLVLCDNRVKSFKEKDAVQNAWEKAAENLDFAENGNFTRASSNSEYFEDSRSRKIVLCPKFLKNISKPIRFSQTLFWIWVDRQFKTVLSNNNEVLSKFLKHIFQSTSGYFPVIFYGNLFRFTM